MRAPQNGLVRYLFLDLNSFFASVEQQEDPRLRDRPVAVGAVNTPSSAVIAASYEAKAYGIKTGTNIGEALRMCPELILVKSEPPKYMAYHNRILEAVDQVLPVRKVHSIDELDCQLLGKEQTQQESTKLAERIKKQILTDVGECLTCSVGLAPNPFLAKVASDMQKPDGLIHLTSEVLHNRLCDLPLKALPGINNRMAARLGASGIFTVSDLLRCSEAELRSAFGSVDGARWWYKLRGYDYEDEPVKKQTLGHSHVLPPNLRFPDGARQVLTRLASKASARLRSKSLLAGELTISVKEQRENWHSGRKLNGCCDSISIVFTALELWDRCPLRYPRQVGIALSDLRPREQVTPSLFDDSQDEREKLSSTIDRVNQKMGKNTIYVASMSRAKDTASEKLAFQKTSLFSEGKDDNVWVSTRNSEMLTL
jgi:DNA polymerase-4